MDIKKLIQVVFFVLKRNDYKLNYMKLIKLLYLSDRLSLDKCGESITENDAVSMDNGPVLVELYDFIKNKQNNQLQDEWNRYFKTENYDLICINTDINTDEICEFEQIILNEIETKYHDKSVWEIVSLVHSPEVCPEWKDPNGSSIPIRRNELLSSLGYTPEERSYLMDNEESYKQEDKKFSKVCLCR